MEIKGEKIYTLELIDNDFKILVSSTFQDLWENVVGMNELMCRCGILVEKGNFKEGMKEKRQN